LHDFLAHDQGHRILVGTYSVNTGGILSLRVYLPDGRFTKAMYVSDKVKQLHIAIREEDGEDSVFKRKILYGFVNEPQWDAIDFSQHCARFELATKVSETAPWEILIRPRRLFLSLCTPKNELPPSACLSEEVREFQDALTQGLADRVLIRRFKIMNPTNRYVAFDFQHKRRAIYGFPQKIAFVWARINEEVDQIMARFYRQEADCTAAAPPTPIRTAVLSKKVADGWQVLDQPLVVQTANRSRRLLQKARMACKALTNFVLEDQPDGAYFDLEPYRVYDKELRLFIDGRVIIIKSARFRGARQAFARIVVIGNEKTIRVWLSEKTRASGKAPVVERPLAQKEDEIWQLREKKISEAALANQQASTRYAGYLNSSSNKIFTNFWQIRTKLSGNTPCHYVVRIVLGTRIWLSIPVEEEEPPETVFAATRLVGGSMKLVEFWRTEDDYRQHTPPLVRRLIAYQDCATRRWYVRPLPVAMASVMQLVQEGKLSAQQQAALQEDPYLKLAA
jgi:hypothetical protein